MAGFFRVLIQEFLDVFACCRSWTSSLHHRLPSYVSQSLTPSLRPCQDPQVGCGRTSFKSESFPWSQDLLFFLKSRWSCALSLAIDWALTFFLPCVFSLFLCRLLCTLNLFETFREQGPLRRDLCYFRAFLREGFLHRPLRFYFLLFFAFSLQELSLSLLWSFSRFLLDPPLFLLPRCSLHCASHPPFRLHDGHPIKLWTVFCWSLYFPFILRLSWVPLFLYLINPWFQWTQSLLLFLISWFFLR